MAERVFLARKEQLEAVWRFVEQQLELAGCANKARLQLELAVEEIFVNIASYAYPPGKEGTAAVCFCTEGRPRQAVLQFRDQGRPFDPLAAKEAQVTLSAEERDVGGLGILIVKKSMDSVDYAYVNGENVLTIRKKIGE